MCKSLILLITMTKCAICFNSEAVFNRSGGPLVNTSNYQNIHFAKRPPLHPDTKWDSNKVNTRVKNLFKKFEKNGELSKLEYNRIIYRLSLRDTMDVTDKLNLINSLVRKDVLKISDRKAVFNKIKGNKNKRVLYKLIIKDVLTPLNDALEVRIRMSRH